MVALDEYIERKKKLRLQNIKKEEVRQKDPCIVQEDFNTSLCKSKMRSRYFFITVISFIIAIGVSSGAPQMMPGMSGMSMPQMRLPQMSMPQMPQMGQGGSMPDIQGLIQRLTGGMSSMFGR